MRAVLAALVLASVVLAPVIGQQAAPANESPSQFYLRYRAAVPTARTVSEVVEFWSADQRSAFNAAPSDGRVTLDQIKAMFRAVSAVKVVNASTTATTATVEAEGLMNGKPVRATVQLAREKGGWRVASGPETWR